MPKLQNPAVMAGGSLPQTIPPATLPWGKVADPQGNVIGESVVDVNWYLFLYGLAKSALNGADGGIPVTPPDFIALSESDIADVDALQGPRIVANAMLLEALDIELARADNAVVAQRAANAYALAMDALLPDPVPQAQPAQTLTVASSPFTFTAPANGTLSINGAGFYTITLIRQATTVATGLLFGLIPMSRRDQVQIVYTFAAPTVVFLPT